MNPYDAPTARSTPSAEAARAIVFPRSALIGAALSLIAPIVACLIVIHWLVGVENLKRHYWLTDGLVISAGLNVMVLAPLAHRKTRRFATGYALSAAVLIFLFVLCGYGYWMVALMGV